MKRIIIVGNARCYHTMDWYRAIFSLHHENDVWIATDLIDSESHVKLVQGNDKVIDLFNIDRLLLNKQNSFGNIWRNLIKLLLYPVQVYKLKKLYKEYPTAVYHAHTMYYMFICWLAGFEYIGTPQGSEILIRPDKSALYKYFAIKSLRAAKVITVDSVVMRDRIKSLSGVDAKIVQYGVDIEQLVSLGHNTKPKTALVSIRGMTKLYRIKELLEARAVAALIEPITFIYPFWDELYKSNIKGMLVENDIDLGRLEKTKMYDLLATAMLVFSIPESDSSPRSVYEAIFSGAIVASTYAPWIDLLPECMRSRLVLVSLDDPSWFNSAIEFARSNVGKFYMPSHEAFELFDQKRSMTRVLFQLYDAAD